MCGILFYDGLLLDNEYLIECLNNISLRGPDNQQIHYEGTKFFGFNRLSINGLDESSNQPFVIDNIILIVNGEIFNWKTLYEENPEFNYKSNSDCEIIIHMYKKYGIDKMIKSLDGEFAFVLYDKNEDKLIIGRDHLGIRGLFIGTNDEKKEIMVGSELKSIHQDLDIKQFSPGHYYVNGVMTQYYNYEFETKTYDQTYITSQLNYLLTKAVEKRLMSDRPISCLLSGGLDSTLVCAIVKKLYKHPLNTYSIGIKGSTDLKYAKIASEYLGTNHTSIELEEEEFLNAIQETIYAIESYDTTTVRASVGNYLVSKYIKENSEDTVLFCGDVSDEIFGSYRGFTLAPNEEEFKKENEKMLSMIHYFDVLRSDRSISNCSLEARVPFCDKDLVNFVMSLHPRHKMFNREIMEKMILRKSFEGYLPDELLYRRKEAFSDGVSSVQRSWHTIIKEYTDSLISDEKYNEEIKKYSMNTPYDKESLYYRSIFENFYKDKGNIIPYFWRHPFSQSEDPSARNLSCY